MTDVHGIVYAYHSSPALGDLTRNRTNASLPFAGRYRLIDFALSSLSNAGVRDVGVIMQRDFQSLLDHVAGGKAWDISRRRGGLKLLPPFGTHHVGEYAGTAEALNAVMGYVKGIPQEHIVLIPADVLCNVDIAALVEQHVKSGCGITAVCTKRNPEAVHYRLTQKPDGKVEKVLFHQTGAGEGLAAMEIYVAKKETLLDLLAHCEAENRFHFHKDCLAHYLEQGGEMDVFLYEGYTTRIDSVDDYYRASMDMLKSGPRADLFPQDRPVRTKERSDVSTYYGEDAKVENSLIADGCFIEGTVKNCVLFRGVRVAPGAVLENCIVMQDTVIGEGAALKYIISDKNVEIAPYVTLTGGEKLPLVLPKRSKL